MTRITFTILLYFSMIGIWAQSGAIHPGDLGFRQKYADFDFKGQFAGVIDRDGVNNYFLLDFSKLASRFERVYFMNLTFDSYQLVNIDPIVTEDRICFMANEKYDKNEQLSIFEELKNKTTKIAATWSGDEKVRWLKKNDKYK